MPQYIQKQFIIPEDCQSQRLDQAIASLLGDYSRSQIKTWIESGELLLDEVVQKPKYKIHGGENVVLNAKLEMTENWGAQDLPIDVQYQDESIIVINKPVGLTVHPGAGTPDQTLANALLYHFPDLALLPRAGIVHRLDRDTSGLMVVAKTPKARQSLINQLQTRSMSRMYWAIIEGVPVSGFTVDAPIDRHPKQRTKMAIAPQDMGRPAVTHFKVLEKFQAHSLLEAKLETGRTHQIRVHLASKGYPIVGDQVYGRGLRLPKGASDELIAALRGFKHQALHAWQLALIHPETDALMQWQADPPQDFLILLDLLTNR